MANPLVLLILSATIGIIIGPPAATDDQTRGKWTACSQTIGRPTCSDWASRMDLNWGKGLDPTHHHQTSATIGEGWTCRAQPIETIDIPPAVSEGGLDIRHLTSIKRHLANSSVGPHMARESTDPRSGGFSISDQKSPARKGMCHWTKT